VENLYKIRAYPRKRFQISIGPQRIVRCIFPRLHARAVQQEVKGLPIIIHFIAVHDGHSIRPEETIRDIERGDGKI
jgi:hypothetical protein